MSSAPLVRARVATMAVFFVTGMIFASWGVNVPTVRDRFGLDAAQLSLALFAAAGGSIAAMTFVGPLLTRVGHRSAYLVGGTVLSASAAAVLRMPTYPAVLASLAVMGMASSSVDVAMNAEASELERRIGRPIMSSLHGMWSLGGMLGAAAGGAVLSLGISPEGEMVGAAVVCAATILIARAALLPRDAAAHRAASDANRGGGPRLLKLLGLVALVGLVAEGAMYDWSTVYMRDVVHAAPAPSSAGFAAFSAGMALGRFGGDSVRARTSAAQLMAGGCALAALGVVAALLSRSTLVAIVGFGAVGLGLANMMPLIFVAAANVDGTPPAEGLARVAGIAYVGMLIGPVVIGAVAQWTTLPTAFWVVTGCVLVVASMAPPLMKRARI